MKLISMDTVLLVCWGHYKMMARSANQISSNLVNIARNYKLRRTKYTAIGDEEQFFLFSGAGLLKCSDLLYPAILHFFLDIRSILKRFRLTSFKCKLVDFFPWMMDGSIEVNVATIRTLDIMQMRVLMSLFAPGNI